MGNEYNDNLKIFFPLQYTAYFNWDYENNIYDDPSQSCKEDIDKGKIPV